MNWERVQRGCRFKWNLHILALAVNTIVIISVTIYLTAYDWQLALGIPEVIEHLERAESLAANATRLCGKILNW